MPSRMPKAELDKINAWIGKAHECLELLGNDAMSLYLSKSSVDYHTVEKHRRSLRWYVTRASKRIFRELDNQYLEAEEVQWRKNLEELANGR